MLLVGSSASSGYLAANIASHLQAKPLKIERKAFGDGEKYCRILNESDLLGSDAVFVASTHSDQDFLELVRIGNALSNAGTKRNIFIIPFYGYSTMERASNPGELPMALINAKILSSIPSKENHFILLDMHSEKTLEAFCGPIVQNIHAIDLLASSIVPRRDIVFASTDMGKSDVVESLAKKFKTSCAFIKKVREFEKTTVMSVSGDVSGKDVIIYDDMIRSGGTLLNACEAYLKRGANSIEVITSHLALNNAGIASLLERSIIEKITCTNSHPMSQIPVVKNSRKFNVLDCSILFADKINELLD
jgi:ribose-phosphate pyrophosphokinase